MKKCSKCKLEKPLIDYYSDTRTPLGVQPCCKECFKIRANQYRRSSAGKEVMKKYRQRSYVKEKVRLFLRKYRKTDKWKEYWKKYRQKESHKDYCRKYDREYRKSEKAKLNDQFNGANYRGKKRCQSDGTVTFEAITSLLEKQKHKCNLCSTDLRIAKKHLDHIHPISLGGAHSIKNTQWLCSKCNIRKSNHVK